MALGTVQQDIATSPSRQDLPYAFKLVSEMALQSTHTDPNQQKLGFQGLGFDWHEYIKYRPLYPPSFYNKLYEHHAKHSNVFGTAHDAGAGAGMVAESLAERFGHVIVSEPNTEFLDVSKARLSGIPGKYASKFNYLAEGAETSSVPSNSVDMLIISEAIHWTDIPTSVNEFARQLKTNGTLCIVFYGPCRITNNDAVQGIWEGLFHDVATGIEKMDADKKGVYYRALMNAVTGFDDVALPNDVWKDGVKRIFTNTGGNRRNVAFSGGCKEAPDKVGKHDQRVFVEGDEEWILRGVDLDWLQNAFVNFVPGKKISDDAGRWEDMEKVLGREGRIDVAWPSVHIVATKK